MKKVIFVIILFTSLFLASNITAQDRKIRKNFDAGTILIAVNPEQNNGNEFDPSTKPYQEEIIGISSGNNNPQAKKDLLVKEGITLVKFNNENGPIKKGDVLTSSSETGVAMKSTKSGMVFGIALEDATSSNGLLKIRMLIQYVKQ